MRYNRLSKHLTFVVLILTSLGLSGCNDDPETPTTGGKFGQFVGEIITRWDENGRDMVLVNTVKYIDGNGKIWKVPAGTIINGATIPESLWSLVGSPYVGKYRNASVVHDHYTVVRTETWQDVHRMFYHAALAGGLEEKQAQLMYAAVFKYGPRWVVQKLTTAKKDGEKTIEKNTPSKTTRRSRRVAAPSVSMPANKEALALEIEKMRNFVRQGNHSLNEIENFVQQ